MSGPTSLEPSLARSIVEQIDRLVRDAETEQRPLELDPYRSRLFELFVMAEAGDLLAESGSDAPAKGNASDLTADGLCKTLAQRWNLADATREAFDRQTRIPPEHLARMRLLWSLMRMWMEWTYAWKRWPEFHRDAKTI